MSESDLALLARYTREKAEDAFTELVRRHLNLVYSTALRQLRSPELAEEVAQSTFVKLAGNAARLAPDTILSAWLYQVSYREAINVGVREARRKLREQIATEMTAMNATADDWVQIEPILDEAMHALDEADRTAVLLRFFENKSLREVGQTLGTNEDAAQKRVSRALERLRGFFSHRGVALGSSSLVLAISANAVQAAPIGLLTNISSAAMLAGTAGLTVTHVAPAGFKHVCSQLISTTKAKIALGAIGVASLAIPLAFQHSANETLRIENASLQSHLADWPEYQKLWEENQRLGGVKVDSEALRQAREEHAALLRLRGEVSRLRSELGQPAKKILTYDTQQNTEEFPWRVGAEIRLEHLRDAGLASPENTIETYFWAAANLQTGRFRQCMATGTNDPSIMPEYATETLKQWQAHNVGPNQYKQARGILLKSLALINESSALVEVWLVKPWALLVGKQTYEDDPRSWVGDHHKIKLAKINGEWKVLPGHSLAALKFLNLLDYSGPTIASQAWPALQPEAAEEVRATISPAIISLSYPWMQDPNAKPK